MLVGAAALPFALATGGAWWTTETAARHRAEDQGESASELASRALQAVLARLGEQDPSRRSAADRLAKALGVPAPTAALETTTPSPAAQTGSAADSAARILREVAEHAEARGRVWQWVLVLSALEAPERDAARLTALTAKPPLSEADQARSASSFASAARAADTASAAWTVVAARGGSEAGAGGEGAGNGQESAAAQRSAWAAAARALRTANPRTPAADLAQRPGAPLDAASASSAGREAARALLACAADWPCPAPRKLVETTLAAVREFQAE